MKILVAEDEPRIASDIAASLREAGFVVDVAIDGEDAWFRGDTESYDAIVLDRGLPNMDGLDILRRWRGAGSLVPVLVLTARGVWTDRVDGINAGADDYLAKPFRTEELLARLRALLRRAAGQPSPILKIGRLSLDTRMMQVAVDGEPVALTPTEYRLVAFLMHHPGRVVPATELADHLYGSGNDKDPNAIEVIVARLRRKIGGASIENRRGYGYLLADATL